MAKKREKKKRKTGREKKGNNNFPLSLFYKFRNSKESHGIALKELLQETSLFYFLQRFQGCFFTGTGFAATKNLNIHKGIETQCSTPVVQKRSRAFGCCCVQIWDKSPKELSENQSLVPCTIIQLPSLSPVCSHPHSQPTGPVFAGHHSSNIFSTPLQLLRTCTKI